MRKILKDEKGSSSIEFAIGVVLLIFIFVSTFEPIILTYKQMSLEQAKMKCLDEMQIRGGLTTEIEQAVTDYLDNRGFDTSNINIVGTIAAVNWGEEVEVEITYDDTTYQYQRSGLLSFERIEEPVTLNVYGSTVSYYYDNN